MSYGALLFREKIPYVVEMEGDVEGMKFSVRGKGHGDANTGKIEASFICTTGELPVPWSSILTTVTYGAQCFAKYPNDIKDYPKSAMPEGYVQERTITFENDGVYKTRAEVTYEKGSVYNRVTLNGSGFKKGGNILGKKLEFNYNPHCIYVLPDVQNNGIKCYINIVHDVIGGGQIIAAHQQLNTPLGGGPVDIPHYHHIQAHTILSKDPKETRDHMNVVEVFRAIDCKTAYA
uniref:Green fluorescent protein FP1 n=1 Tax=Aequorea australis TaxID=1246302 RepID=A0A5J6CYI5_9CNID|nr:green fluorescent protein FP1 [Aequorea australis]